MNETAGARPEGLSDDALRLLLVEDASRGWEAFIRQHTATLLALIERAGITDKDEAMELYVLVCERLADNDCARLRRHDPARGPLAAWLATVLRNVTVDWVRSRAGRRRLFAAVKALDRVDQRVFELYYWEQRAPGEIAELLGMETGGPVDLVTVLDALARIEAVLKDRQRSELVSFVARTRRAASLESSGEAERVDPPDPAASPEAALGAAELEAASRAAIASLPPEDAVIVRLKFFEGLSDRDIARALHLDEPVGARVQRILDRLRARLETPLAAGRRRLRPQEGGST